MTVGIALMTQMGEQADYLRFMPARTAGQPAPLVGWAWPSAGPGWVLPGVLKMLGGALLAWIAIGQSVPLRPRGRPEPDVPGGLGHRVQPARHWRWRRRRCSSCCRSSRSTSPTPMPARWPGPTSSRGSRTATRAASSGSCSTRPIALMLMELDVFTVLGQGAGPVRQHRDLVADGGGGRPGRQQAAGPVAARHRVPARLPVRRQPGGRRRDGRRLGAEHRGAPGRVRRRWRRPSRR